MPHGLTQTLDQKQTYHKLWFTTLAEIHATFDKHQKLYRKHYDLYGSGRVFGISQIILFTHCMPWNCLLMENIVCAFVWQWKFWNYNDFENDIRFKIHLNNTWLCRGRDTLTKSRMEWNLNAYKVIILKIILAIATFEMRISEHGVSIWINFPSNDNKFMQSRSHGVVITRSFLHYRK